jgi:hypothetical protein
MLGEAGYFFVMCFYPQLRIISSTTVSTHIAMATRGNFWPHKNWRLGTIVGDALKIATFGGVPVGEQFMLTESREWYTKITA